MIILNPKIQTVKKLVGAAEACWAHNPEVGGSKPSLAILEILTAIKK